MPRPTHHFHIHPDAAALQQALADFILQQSQQAIRQNGRFTLCLSGGSTPKGLYERLAGPPYREKIDWSQVHVFWGDERCVPPDHPDSNFRMAQEALLQQVPIPPAQIHPIDGRLAPAEAAAQYEALLQSFFFNISPAFDLVLLGLGDDGHTASLFPHTDVLAEKKRWVKEVYVPGKDSYRISLTAPLINQARQVAFLVQGAGKAAALRAVTQGDYQSDTYPAQLIQPVSGRVEWFVDEGAALEIRL